MYIGVPMKVIVAGSRTLGHDIKQIERIQSVLRHSPFEIDELVHGGAKGVDSVAENVFSMVRENPEITCFEPDWGEYGDSAGPIRNREMAEYSDALIAFWDGESAGTRDMINKALDNGLDVHVVQMESGDE